MPNYRLIMTNENSENSERLLLQQKHDYIV
jgi:hypothetical protein